MGPDDFADAVEVATRTDAARHAHLPVPNTSNESVIHELDLCLAAIAGDLPKRADKRAASDEKLPGLLHPLVVPASQEPLKKRKSALKPAVGCPVLERAMPCSAPATLLAASPSLPVTTPLPPPVSPSASSYDVGPPLGRVT